MRSMWMPGLAVLLLGLTPCAARAQNPDFTFTLAPASSQSNPILVQAGSTFVFTGTAANGSLDTDELITGHSFSDPYTTAHINDALCTANFDNQDIAAGSSLTAKIFSVKVDASAPVNTLYNMTFTLNTTDPFFGNAAFVQRFFIKVTPSSVPAPGTVEVLCGAALCGLGARRSSRLSRRAKFAS